MVLRQQKVACGVARSIYADFHGGSAASGRRESGSTRRLERPRADRVAKANQTDSLISIDNAQDS
jgi:hypothetical protein